MAISTGSLSRFGTAAGIRLTQRILIVGLGSIGKRHLRIVRETLPDAEIRLLRHQPSHEIPELANSVCATLEDAVAFAPHMAVIASPAPFHLQSATALVKAGCHVLIEKPLAADSAGVATFLAEVRDARVVCQVGYNLRYSPSLVEFRRLLHEGLIGRLMSVRCEIGQYLPDWRLGTDYRQGVSARRDLGGGVLLELSHEIDYLRWIFGEVQWVIAWMGHLSDLDIDVEDSAQLMMGFSVYKQDKAVVASLNMDFIRRDATRICVVIGAEGSLRWNGLKGTVEFYAPGADSWQEKFYAKQGRDDSYRAQWLHFLACVEGAEQPSVTAEDGLAVLKIVETAKKSSQINSKVGL